MHYHLSFLHATGDIEKVGGGVGVCVCVCVCVCGGGRGGEVRGGGPDNAVKNWQNLSISNPKSGLHKVNTQTKFGENELIFTQVIVQKQKYKCVTGR